MAAASVPKPRVIEYWCRISSHGSERSPVSLARRDAFWGNSCRWQFVCSQLVRHQRGVHSTGTQRICHHWGEERVDMFCDFNFRYDDDQNPIRIHQEKFGRLMLERYGPLGCRSCDTPMLLGSSPLVPWLGESSAKGQMDFLMLIGDLHWATRANPGLV